MSRVFRVIRSLKVLSISYKYINITLVRRCSSSNRRPHIDAKDITSIYTKQWEPKLLRIKHALNTKMDFTNVQYMDKCSVQIDEINHGLKALCQSIQGSKDTTIETLNQNIKHLHHQLQLKTQSNQRSEEHIADFEEEIETQRAENEALNQTIQRLEHEFKAVETDRNNNKTMVQELKETNDTIQIRLENIQNELKILEQANESNQNEMNEEEISKTKSNMGHLLKDLIDLENQYKRLKIVTIGLGAVLLVGLIDVYKTRKQITQTRQQLQDVERKIHFMLFFNDDMGD
eukprot:183292_1